MLECFYFGKYFVDESPEQSLLSAVTDLSHFVVNFDRENNRNEKDRGVYDRSTSWHLLYCQALACRRHFTCQFRSL